ncbi:hypothetical protein LAB1_35400 [Roseibium sp. LAB1]
MPGKASDKAELIYAGNSFEVCQADILIRPRRKKRLAVFNGPPFGTGLDLRRSYAGMGFKKPGQNCNHCLFLFKQRCLTEEVEQHCKPTA